MHEFIINRLKREGNGSLAGFSYVALSLSLALSICIKCIVYNFIIEHVEYTSGLTVRVTHSQNLSPDTSGVLFCSAKTAQCKRLLGLPVELWSCKPWNLWDSEQRWTHWLWYRISHSGRVACSHSYVTETPRLDQHKWETWPLSLLLSSIFTLKGCRRWDL